MVNKSVFPFLFVALLLLGSTLAVPSVLAVKDPREIDTHPPIHIKKFSGTSPSGYDPQIIWNAYGFKNLTCSHTATTDWTDPNLCGHGQTIAIVDAYNDPNIASDLQTFDTQFGLPSCPAGSCLVKLEPQGNTKTNSGWVLETSLDVEWAHAVAPGAKIVLVEAANSYLNNLLSAVDAGVGQGAKQLSMSWGGSEFSSESSYDYHFNSKTTSFFASSGDSGSGVEYPAASPFVVSVGGTTLNVDSSGNYIGETAWSGSGGGVSAYEPRPTYQNNFNPYGERAIPDVAYDADPNTGVAVYDSVTYNGQSGWFEVGGTSAGAPQWSAISAIANSGNANLASASFGISTALYGAASGAESNPQTTPYISNYHDVTTGSNGACGSVCNAGSGYDEVTGLGSIQSNNLIPYLTPVPTPDFIISANPSSLSVASGSSTSSTITITSVNGFASAVSLSVSSTTGASLALSSLKLMSGGSNSTTLTVTPTSSGTYAVTGTSGSLSHSTSVSVTVETAPSAPQSLQGTAGDRQVSLSWQAPSSTGGLPITYSIFRNGTQIAPSITTTSYTDTGLTNGDTDTYYVEAVNSVGASGPSNTVSVVPQPTPSLSVAVSPNKLSYSTGSTAYITVTVISGTVNISGASVTLTVTTPNGSTSQSSGTTNSNGQVVFGVHIPKHAQKGAYTASAMASDAGYLSGSGTATFQVT
ncbi:MAG: hypothetical protein KGH88_08680 [Thaumarchaeota archaeon]|nr:hypothetical protein [Nitrososphaerota archaeon]